MSQRAQRAIYRSLALGATPYRLPESQQCKAEIVDERERYGRNVVAQVRCRKMTRNESGYCHIHRQTTGDMTADTDPALDGDRDLIALLRELAALPGTDKENPDA